MSPEPPDDVVRRRMLRQRRRDTGTEWAIRRRLHAAGFRYRVDVRPDVSLRCRGDIVFARAKVVVFIDGCFWHGCPLHGTQPKKNAEWWRDKLAKNVERDRRNTENLMALGWCVVRVWEHEDLESALARITIALGRK